MFDLYFHRLTLTNYQLQFLTVYTALIQTLGLIHFQYLKLAAAYHFLFCQKKIRVLILKSF